MASTDHEAACFQLHALTTKSIAIFIAINARNRQQLQPPAHLTTYTSLSVGCMLYACLFVQVR